MRALFRLTAVFFLLALLIGAWGAQAQEPAAQKELRILRVNPSGENVAAGRQIVITFNRPVVPLGRMERSAAEIPVLVAPPVNCEWRWIDTTSLACQLDEKSALKPSSEYIVTVNPGIEAEDGATIAQKYESRFTTQRADVTYSWFRTWRGPGTPVIRLTFNQPVTKASVEKSLFFAAAQGEGKTALAASPDPEAGDTPVFIAMDNMLFYTGDQPARKSDDRKTEVKGAEARRIWLVEPVAELAQDSGYKLELQPGLVSAEGPAPGAAARTVVAFDTYPAFSVLGIRCTTNDGENILIPPGGSAGDKRCNPLAPVALSFSVPVKKSQVRDHFVFTPALGKAADRDKIWGDLTQEYSRLGSPHEKGRSYDVNLPYGLKAAQEYRLDMSMPQQGIFMRAWLWIKSFFTDVPATGLENEFGQKLGAPVSLAFATDHRKPNFVLVHNEAVLEKAIDSEVPLYVNNLAKVDFDYRRVTGEGAKAGLKAAQDIPAVQDVQFAVPFGVREALGGKSGALYGHLKTEPVVDKGWDGAHRLFAVVSPWQLHVKLGHFSTLVWVTDMSDGQPVEGAKVVVYQDAISTLGAPKDIRASAVTDAQGIARLPGTDKLDPQLELNRGWEDSSPHLFVRVDHAGDMALMPLNNDFLINTWRASDEGIRERARKKFGHLRSWGTTAQGIYRAGDTMQYKFYVRHQDDRSLIPAPREGYKLEILDPRDNVVETVDNLKLNAFGAYDGSFLIGKEAPVGWYRFRLTAGFMKAKGESGEEGEYYDEDTGAYVAENVSFPLQVLVSDFTPAPFRAENSLNGDLFSAGQQVEVQSRARLHSGGPFADAPLRVTAQLSERAFASKDPKATGFTFTAQGEGGAGTSQIHQKRETVDGKGDNVQSFVIPEQSFAYGRLTVESAVQDDRGKYIAATAQADYVGVDRFVGLKSPQWSYDAKKPMALQYIVVDEKGAPVADTEAAILIEREETVAVRVKGAGNAYLTNYETSWVKAGECKGKPASAAAACDFTPSDPGSYRATATVSDTQGRSHRASLDFWVRGEGYVMWNNRSDVILPIVPEKAEYKVGDKARFLLKNPLPGTAALVTVERYGVLDSFVQKLDGSTPVIEFEVKPDYLPGFYMSVVAVSPRVEKPADDAGVDLGKPTVRMGYVTVPVRDDYKQMDVAIAPAAEVYRPGDKVSVEISARPRMPGAEKEPVEIAVAVLDEAVFDLIAAKSANFDPYRGFYSLSGLDLRNYNLLMKMVGRQKFEKKGANQGGDGGAALSMRELFKFVAYWNPSLKPGADGKARVEFDAPDNLTGWRVLALAVTPSDRLGLGEGGFKVNRPTEVRPVMPNQVSEGDSFRAGFSVMNRTDKPRTLAVEIRASGDIEGKETSHREEVTLEPYKRATVYLPVTAAPLPLLRDVAQGEIRFEATARDGVDADGVASALPVLKSRSLETAAQFGSTVEARETQSIAFPQGIYPDAGNVSVTLSPTVLGAVEGAFRYMRDYIHACWEQLLSKGVMAAHYQSLKAYIPDSFSWPESQALPQAMLDRAQSFQAPNGGMAYFIAADEYADPYLSAYTAISFNWLRDAGYKVPAAVEGKLQGYLLDLLRKDTMPSFYDKGMASTVRAVALAALARHGKAEAADLARFQPFLAQMSLFGRAHFLQAAVALKDEKAAEAAASLILSAGNQTAGKFVFSEELDDSYLRILASPLRENCAILDAMTAYAATDKGRALAGDVTLRLARSIVESRKDRDHWENTQENMFCMQALVAYNRAYESEKPAMDVTVALNGAAFGTARLDDLRDPAVTLARDIAPGDAGEKAEVAIAREGKGRLYYATRLQYAPLDAGKNSVNAGMTLKREYSVEREGKWQLLAPGDGLRRGEVVRVDLYLSAPAARNFVAVTDPLPGGLEIVNRDLATASGVDAEKGDFEAAGGSWYFQMDDWQGYAVSRWSFYHREMRHDSARFYADYLPPGNYHLSYTAQAIAEGDFAARAPQAEEMYDPDVYGKDVSRKLGISAPGQP